MISAPPRLASAYHYVIGNDVVLRARPRADGELLRRLDHNETVVPRAAPASGWQKVSVLGGQVGYLPTRALSNVWIRVLKKQRRLQLLHDKRVIKDYRLALSPGNALGDKRQLGDNRTPEGRFYLAEMIRHPENRARYGARSMRISYPSIRHARDGLARRLFDYRRYLAIVKAIRQGRLPDQRTKLGSSIRIHGGGSRSDWTAGCMALDDADIRDLYDRVRHGTRVEIYRSRRQAETLAAPDALAAGVLAGARAQLKAPARYTRYAMGAPSIAYPNGDIRRSDAVCSDIIVRAVRRVGIDLQAAVHEDRLLHPERYRRGERPNSRIDHRRVRNLHRYLLAHALRGDPRQTAKTARPGDLVLFDTGIQNGTPFDHIGIVDDQRGADGVYRVVNIWTVGHRTSSMALVGRSYPTVVGHFRWGHPFDYH